MNNLIIIMLLLGRKWKLFVWFFIVFVAPCLWGFFSIEYSKYENDDPNIFKTINSYYGVETIVKGLDLEKRARKIIYWQDNRDKEAEDFWKEVDDGIKGNCNIKFH